MCSEYGLLVAFDGLYGVTIRQLLLTVRKQCGSIGHDWRFMVLHLINLFVTFPNRCRNMKKAMEQRALLL